MGLERLLIPALVCAALAVAEDRVGGAIAALQSGDLHTAESLLRGQLAAEPKDAAAMAVLAVVLDREGRSEDAGRTYQKALVLDGSDPSLLNNYGNHLLAAGHAAEARRAFAQAVAIEPANRNANVQLAKLALDGKNGREAMAALDRLRAADRWTPDVELLFGMALSSVHRYAEAEAQFRKLTEAEPGNFDAQYGLGLAASKGNHLALAEQALQRALELKPDSAEVIYDLAVVNLKQDKGVEAIALLARGTAAAPNDTGLERLLAETASRLGYFEDSVQAWDRYLVLQPADAEAKRERAFAQSAIAPDPAESLAELRAYTVHHPQDAMGHYELGTALSASDPGEAGKQLSRAIELDPQLTAAYVARGLLAYRSGKSDAAVKDFAAAARQQPNNARVLDRLGEAYLTAGQMRQGLAVLQKASAMAPEDGSVLLHLGRALTKSGQQAEAATVFARYRSLDHGNNAAAVHGTGLVDFLSLPPGEQQARYRAGVERTVAAQPDNAEAEVRYLEILLADGKSDAAAGVCNKLLQLDAAPELISEAGSALLEAGDFGEAEALLNRSIAAGDSSPTLQVQLAQARSYRFGGGSR